MSSRLFLVLILFDDPWQMCNWYVFSVQSGVPHVIRYVQGRRLRPARVPTPSCGYQVQISVADTSLNQFLIFLCSALNSCPPPLELLVYMHTSYFFLPFSDFRHCNEVRLYTRCSSPLDSCLCSCCFTSLNHFLLYLHCSTHHLLMPIHKHMWRLQTSAASSQYTPLTFQVAVSKQLWYLANVFFKFLMTTD